MAVSSWTVRASTISCRSTPSQRKFYRTVIRVEVLTEDPRALAKAEDLHQVADLLNGCWDSTGFWTITKGPTTLNGKQAARYLAKDGGDPGVMNLNEKGEDVE